MYDWRDKPVVVTGASSGIGRELARILGAAGAQLALVARRADALGTLKRELEAAGAAEVLAVPCDIGDAAEVEEMRRQVEGRWGAAEVLINNAGFGAYGPFVAGDLATYESLTRTNLLGAIYCTRALLPGMLSRGRGRLVFVSSIVAELPSPGHAVYSASKFAVSGLAESLDYELADRGISVHLVEPGLVRTEFAERAGIPGRRFEQMPSKSPAEVAAAVVKAVGRGKRKIVPDARAHMAIKLRRHFPRLARLIFKRVFRSF